MKSRYMGMYKKIVDQYPISPLFQQCFTDLRYYLKAYAGYSIFDSLFRYRVTLGKGGFTFFQAYLDIGYSLDLGKCLGDRGNTVLAGHALYFDCGHSSFSM